jgi:hypothetical protein
MNTLLPAMPPPNRDRLGELLELTRLLADPAATAKRITDLQTAAETARAAAEEAKQAQAAAIAERDAADRDIKAARKKHDGDLASDRAIFDAEVKRRTRDIEARESAAAALQATATKAVDEASALKADLNKRLDAIRSAAGGV